MKEQVLDYSSPKERPPFRLTAGMWAVLAVVCVIMLMVVSSFLSFHFGRPNRKVRVECAMKLRDVGKGILLYKNDHQGQYPDTLEQVMLHADIQPHVFVCPESRLKPAKGATREEQAANLHRHLSFIYLGKGLKDPVDPDCVIAYDPLENHDGAGMNILYGDGRVEWFRKSPLQSLPDFGAATSTTRPAENSGE